MHNGRMGRKIDERTIERAKELFKQGLKPMVVASRLGMSGSMARIILKEMQKPVAMPAEPDEWSQLTETDQES